MERTKAEVLAVALLERRRAPPTMGYYLRRNGKRHILWIAIYAGLALAFFLLGHTLLGIATVAFALGRQTRDLGWYRALARDWPLTTEFIDWNKVENIARAAETSR